MGRLCRDSLSLSLAHMLFFFSLTLSHCLWCLLTEKGSCFHFFPTLSCRREGFRDLTAGGTLPSADSIVGLAVDGSRHCTDREVGASFANANDRDKVAQPYLVSRCFEPPPSIMTAMGTEGPEWEGG